MLRDALLRYVGFAKAVTLWMHAAHHLTKGPAFVEKLLYSMDDETFACPIVVSNIATTVLNRYDSPANLPDKEISMIALCILVDHMKGMEVVRDLLSNAGQLTLGMDDFLSAASNQYESYAYMIKQQTKER